MSDFDQPKKTAKGGKRPGAGRKVGVPNKATVDRQNEVAASGATPLDVMIKTMRYHYSEAQQKMRHKDHDRKEVGLVLEAAMRAAKACADFVHPKLASVVSKNDTTLTQVADAHDAREKLQNLMGNLVAGSAPSSSGKPN